MNYCNIKNQSFNQNKNQNFYLLCACPMSLQEVLSLSSQLEKTDDVDRQLDLLKALSQVRMTFDLLVDSKVGASVKSLKKSQDQLVAESAKNLLQDWKIVRDRHVEAAAKVISGL
jgi:hypothetical protein